MTRIKAQSVALQPFTLELPMLRNAVAMRLTAVRRERKLKQTDLAKASGLPLRTVSRLEMKNDPSFPKLDTLAAYLVACDMTLGEFFANWIRPNTTDYDRECHLLLLKALAQPELRGGIRKLLKSLTEESG